MNHYFLKKLDKIGGRFQNPTYELCYIEHKNGFYFQFMYDEIHTALSGEIRISTDMKSYLKYQTPKSLERNIDFKITSGEEIQNALDILERVLEKINYL